MIRHIVMWTLEGSDDHARAGNALLVKAWLEACADLVPGILRFEVTTAQDALAANCDVMLYAEFDSPRALDAYDAHPQHQLLKMRVAPLRAARYAFDYRA